MDPYGHQNHYFPNHDFPGAPGAEQKEGAIGSGFIHAMSILLGISFVTRAFDGESTFLIDRAPPHR
jgi:hypothetical protein